MLAAHGLAALAAVETAQPDVIIADLGMPQMDGFEVIARVRPLGESCASAAFRF